MPYLDDYIMNAHDPFVEDFVWSVDDNPEMDVPRLLLFADQHVTQTVRATPASSAAEVAGHDPTTTPHKDSRLITHLLVRPTDRWV